MTTNYIGSIFCKRMSELFDLRIENDKEVLEGLIELSTFVKNNSPENRRNLQSLIEERSLKLNKNLLAFLQNLRTNFEKINRGINEMNSALFIMKNTLASTKQSTKTLIEKTLDVQKEISNITNQEEIVCNLINRLQLSTIEITALRNPVITHEIFSTLSKGEEIIKQSKWFLQSENSFLIQEILEQMLMYEDTGMDRLFKWARGKCSAHETTVLSSLLPLALAKLQKRQNLFDQIVEELSANRSIILVRQFIDALTLGEKPIELRVTEPRRYINDMLAWLHQALPMEVDYLNFLFKKCDSSDQIIKQTLKRITDGICHPLRVRVEHILLEEENSQNCVLLQDVYILLQDYNNIISQIISHSSLNTTFLELSEVAKKTLLHSLQNKVSALINSDKNPASVNLVPHETVKKVLGLLVELLNANPTSQINKTYVLEVVSCAVDPLMNHITEIASKLYTTDMAVFLLNCFHLIETSLALFPFLDNRLERLKAQCNAQIDTLTSEQASAFIGHFNLGQIYAIFQGNPLKPLSRLQAMSSTKVSEVSAKLEKFLGSPNSYLLPQLTFLSSASHKLAVLKRSFTVVTSLYAKLYEAVYDIENEYKNPEKMLPISPEQLNNLILNTIIS